MTDLTPFSQFNFESHPIRSIEVDGVTMLSAIDCCRALGYIEPAKSWPDLKDRNLELHKHLTTVKLRAVDGKLRETDVIDKDGVVRLCLLAKTRQAERFRDWAVKVLTGHIDVPAEEKLPTHLETARNLVAALERAEAAEQALAIAAPKAELADTFVASEGWLTVTQVADVLARPELGRNNLYKWLIEQKFVYRDGKNYVPMKEYVDLGWFKLVAKTYDKGTEKQVPYTQLMISPKGYRAIVRRLGIGVTNE